MSKQVLDRDIQLTPTDGFDVNRIIFSEIVTAQIPNSSMNYKRVNISTLYPDGKMGDLIFPTERLFSFGVQENTSQETQKVTGHCFPLCLWNKNGVTKDEKEWCDVFEQVVERCKQFVLDNKEELELDEITRPELRTLNPIYWGKKGKRKDNQSPVLYAKLIESKKQDKILSMFKNDDNVVIDPLTLLNKYCYAVAALKIESIYIGAGKVLLQVKLYEANVEVIQSMMKPLLTKPKIQILPPEENKDDEGSSESDTPIRDSPDPKPVLVSKKST
jgi:hypothetical protein